MARMMTPAIERVQKKSKNATTGVGTPLHEAWKRLRRNRPAMIGLGIIAFMLLIGLFAPLIAPYGYREQNISLMLATPSLEHPFGCDHLGRDILSRCIYGARYSLPIGIICVIIGLVIGGGIGIIAAYFGGKVDYFLMRFIDILQAIPNILLCIALVAILGNGVVQLVIAIAAGSIQGMAKTCRTAVFMVRNNEFIDSSKSIGESDIKIMMRHVIPNAVGLIVINAVAGVSGNILTISSLSYIGVGLVSPTPEWGAILSEGKTYLSVAPHCVYMPGLMIAITVLAFNLFGNGLRDALDPRLK